MSVEIGFYMDLEGLYGLSESFSRFISRLYIGAIIYNNEILGEVSEI